MMLMTMIAMPQNIPKMEAIRIMMSPNATMLRGTIFQSGQLGTHVLVRASQKNLSAHVAGHPVLPEVVFGEVDSTIKT